MQKNSICVSSVLLSLKIFIYMAEIIRGIKNFLTFFFSSLFLETHWTSVASCCSIFTCCCSASAGPATSCPPSSPPSPACCSSPPTPSSPPTLLLQPAVQVLQHPTHLHLTSPSCGFEAPLPICIWKGSLSECTYTATKSPGVIIIHCQNEDISSLVAVTVAWWV